MSRPYFYYGTTRSYVVAFATLFTGVQFKDGLGNLHEIPLDYSPKAKWLENIKNNPDLDQADNKITYPRLGFELQTITPATSRNTNALTKFDNPVSSNNTSYMLNRQAYDFGFKLYIGVERFNTLLQVMEQIVPFFTPALTVTLNDTNGISTGTNITIVMNGIDFEIDYEGSFEQSRTITATIDFTLKGYLYSNPRTMERIQSAIMSLNTSDYVEQFEKVIPASLADITITENTEKDPRE